MIDREDLIKRIEYSNNWNNAECPDWVLKMIHEAPDMEVRCKDCRYWQIAEVGAVEVPICAKLQNMYDDRPFLILIDDNGYCSYGEKKCGK